MFYFLQNIATAVLLRVFYFLQNIATAVLLRVFYFLQNIATAVLLRVFYFLQNIATAVLLSIFYLSGSVALAVTSEQWREQNEDWEGEGVTLNSRSRRIPVNLAVSAVRFMCSHCRYVLCGIRECSLCVGLDPYLVLILFSAIYVHHDQLSTLHHISFFPEIFLFLIKYSSN